MQAFSDGMGKAAKGGQTGSMPAPGPEGAQNAWRAGQGAANGALCARTESRKSGCYRQTGLFDSAAIGDGTNLWPLLARVLQPGAGSTMVRWLLFPRGANDPSGGQPKQTAECWALHVTWRGADSGMAKTITHCAQLSNGTVELLRLVREQLTINLGTAVRAYHAADFVQ